jgi:hypothetical protein
MPIRKLRRLGSTTVGVSLPKDELQHDGFVSDEGDTEENNVLVEREGPGEYRVRIIDD